MPDRNGYIGRAPGDSAVTVARQSYTSSGITTDFTFNSGYTVGYFDIYINGVKMIEGSDYTSSDGSTFSVLNGGAADGDVLEAVAYKAFNAANVTASTGNFTVGGDLTVSGSVSFSGAGSSVSFATTSFNLSGTPDITIRNLTGVAATFSGTVSYEDVVNIDSVGIITAQSGIRVGAGQSIGSDSGTVYYYGNGENLTGVASTDNIITGTAATFNNLVEVGSNIKIDATSGIVTATSFYGSGQNLTNLPAGGDSLDVTASLFI